MQLIRAARNPAALLMLLWTVLTVFADPDPTPDPSGGGRLHLTVRQAAALALLHDPQLQQLQKTLEGLRGGMSPRLRARLPVLFIEYGGSEAYDWSSPYQLNHTIGGGFELTLTDSGDSWYRMRELRRELRRTKLEIRQQKQNLILETVQLCTDIFYRRTAVQLLTKELQLYRRLCRSAEQRQTCGSISLQNYRRLRIQAEEKALELQAEQLELQQLYSQLTLRVRHTDERSLRLCGSFPQPGPASFGEPGLPESEYFRARAVEHSVQVISARMNCAQAADQRALQLRRLCPKITVTSRIDFSGPHFPPATPALSFGLRLSTGPGRLSVSAKDSVSRSNYSYNRNPAAKLALDLSRPTASPHRRAVEKEQYARRELQHRTSLAALQAQKLAQETLHLQEQLQHQRASCELHRRELAIRRQEFEFGTADFERLVESRRQYTAGLLKLCRLNQRCLLAACTLLQLCALPERVSVLLGQLSTGEKGVTNDGS